MVSKLKYHTVAPDMSIYKIWSWMGIPTGISEDKWPDEGGWEVIVLDQKRWPGNSLFVSEIYKGWLGGVIHQFRIFSEIKAFVLTISPLRLSMSMTLLILLEDSRWWWRYCQVTTGGNHSQRIFLTQDKILPTFHVPHFIFLLHLQPFLA